MRKGKHLRFYIRSIKIGELPDGWWGLCACAEQKFIDGVLLKLFEPTDIEAQKLIQEGESDIFWGGTIGDFTPLRQNIVLLMAAMNNEL